MTTSQRPIDTQDLNEYVQALKDYVTSDNEVLWANGIEKNGL